MRNNSKFLLIISVICFSCQMLFAAEPAKETEKVSWVKFWKEETVSLGIINTLKVTLPSGKIEERKYFQVIGSGVIMALSNSSCKLPILVTAKHVFFDPAMKWKPPSLQIRFSWFQNKSVFEYYGIPINLRSDDDKPLYFIHPDNAIDLAAIPLSIDKKLSEREKISSDYAGNFAKYEDLYESETVFILGYPGDIDLTYYTKPIFRKGIISWISDDSKYPIPILTDTMVFPGNSGGPAFVDTLGLNPYGEMLSSGKLLFLGIVTTGEIRKAPLGWSVIKKPLSDTKALLIPSYAEEFMGLAGIVPSERVQELLEYVAQVLDKNIK